MKTFISPLFLVVAFLLAGSIATFAGPVNPRGIPADAAAVLHVDFDAGKRSAIYKAAGGFLSSEAKKALAGIEIFRKETGVDIFKDIADVTVGIFGDLSRLSAGDKSAVEVVAFVRGNFNPDTIFVAARKQGYKLTEVRRYTFIEIPDKNGTTDEKFYISPFGTKTFVVLTKLSQAPAVIAAHWNEAKSVTLPASVTSFGQQIGVAPVLVAYHGTKGQAKKPVAAAHADASGTFGMNFQDAEETSIAAGDDGKNLKIRVSALYGTELKAQEAQTSVQGLLGMVGIFLGGNANAVGADGKPNAKKAADIAKLKTFLSAVKVSADGKTFNVSLDYPTADIVTLVREEAEKARKKQAKSAKSPK